MRRAMRLSGFVAMGLLVAAAATATAQSAPASTSGRITVRTLGASDIGSSKFTEYRVVPTGASVPFVNLLFNNQDIDARLYGYNVAQLDQRYLGSVNALGLGVTFDYNQIPHNLGNDARMLFVESAPAVWTASTTLRQALQTATDNKLPTSTRTYDFYNGLFAPTFASANRMDIAGVRKTGNVELGFGKHLPFDLNLTYRQELKEGYRGTSGGNFRAAVSPAYQVAAPLDEVTHDLGLRAAYQFKQGNVFAALNRNIYDNRAETLMVDNLLQAVDAPQTSASGSIPALGGPSRERFVMAPDNQASMGTAGLQLKFQRQTRISATVALARRTQDAPFYPYTANTVLQTPAGQPANSLSALQQASYGGKVNTTMYNLAFSSRPIEGLGIRAQYRVYDLKDKSDKYIITGDVSGAGGTWSVITPSAADPFGHATANSYDTKSSRFTASATYDYAGFTIEGQVRSGKLDRTSREATSGTESGVAATAQYHLADWAGVRGTYDRGKRTAKGETLYGFQMDEAPFTNTRTGVDLELTPVAGLDLGLSYFRRNTEYTGRPDRIAVSGGQPVSGASPIPGTPSGLLAAKYDSYTGEINYAPTARASIGAYYTYEKDVTTNQFSTTTGVNLNNLLRYVGNDKTGTFGANALFQVVPDKGTFMLNASRQKVDGLWDITAREAGSFYTPGRTTLIPAGQGGAADVTDWDDTELTTVSAQFDYVLTRGWTLSTGYTYEDYDFKDAFNSNKSLMPTSLIFITVPNVGAYTAGIVFAQLSYRF